MNKTIPEFLQTAINSSSIALDPVPGPLGVRRAGLMVFPACSVILEGEATEVEVEMGEAMVAREGGRLEKGVRAGELGTDMNRRFRSIDEPSFRTAYTSTFVFHSFPCFWLDHTPW
jgi:hypothetical protein